MLTAIFSHSAPAEKPITGVMKTGKTMYLIEIYGRHEETRTPDLYRVKGKLTCSYNDFQGAVDRISTSKYP
jgi:hypothetical protein